MRYIRKSLTNVLSAVIAMIAIAAVAIRQFYLFITLRSAHDGVGMQGGVHHLWLGIGAILIACIVGLLLFSVFLRNDRKNDLNVAG